MLDPSNDPGRPAHDFPRPPRKCVIPLRAREEEAREIVADHVGSQDFRRFVESAAAGELQEESAAPWAVLTPELLRTTGMRSREMPLPSWAAAHIWRRHGSQQTREKAWKRLRWTDWPLAQRVIDETPPRLQRDGRWRFDSGPLLRLHRPVGFRLIAEGRESVLTPIAWFRVGL